MLLRHLSLLGGCLAAAAPSFAASVNVGGFEEAGSTLVSAMMVRGERSCKTARSWLSDVRRKRRHPLHHGQS